MWIVLLLDLAFACSPWITANGFDPGLDGRQDLPTDAVIGLEIDATSTRVVLVPVEGGDPVAGTIDWTVGVYGGLSWTGFFPTAPLAPNTTYTAEVFVDGWSEFDPDLAIDTATFTTGDGPAAAPLAPTLVDGSQTGWSEEDNVWYCSLGNPVESRTLTVDLELPERDPQSWVLIRPAPGEFGEDRDYWAEQPAETGPLAVTTRVARIGETREAACYVAVVRSPSGEEAVSEPLCLEEAVSEPLGLEEDASAGGCGCDQSGGSAPWWTLGLSALFLGRRRERMNA